MKKRIGGDYNEDYVSFFNITNTLKLSSNCLSEKTVEIVFIPTTPTIIILIVIRFACDSDN